MKPLPLQGEGGDGGGVRAFCYPIPTLALPLKGREQIFVDIRNDQEKKMTIILDGSQGEGGGQILRSALSLSMCTGTPFRIERIRAKRKKPGLLRQHLTAVNAAAEICGAKTEGAHIGSTTLAFTPGRIKAGDYQFAIGSAGSCTLVFQTVLPALLIADAPSRVRLQGGTHNPMAPPFHFFAARVCAVVAGYGRGHKVGDQTVWFLPCGRRRFHGGHSAGAPHAAASAATR